MTKHLRLDLMTLGFDGPKDLRDLHPQQVMKKLGITYQHATPQSIADQWWFWNCENIPAELPNFLTLLNLDPFECIGHGLSKEHAEMIALYGR